MLATATLPKHKKRWSDRELLALPNGEVLPKFRCRLSQILGGAHLIF